MTEVKEIPKQLQNQGFRFVLLGKGGTPKGKVPFEKAWQTNGYVFNDARLLAHLDAGNNIGVIGGYGNLRILDVDKPPLATEISQKTNTFSVRTGSGGIHFYFISDYGTNHVLKDECGELRANNYQVVIPPSLHPNLNYYQVLNDVPIQTISKEELYELIKPFLKPEPNFSTEYTPTGKDTSPSGFEFRRIISLLHKGLNEKEIRADTILANSHDWYSKGEPYRARTFANAHAIYLKQKELHASYENPDDKENENNIEEKTEVEPFTKDDKPKKEKKEKEKIRILTFWGGEIKNTFYELGWLENKSLPTGKEYVFIEMPKYNPELHKLTDELKVLKEIEIDKQTIMLPPKVIPFNIPYAKITWEEIFNAKFESIYELIRKNIECYWTDEEEDYDILAMWVMLSYLQENLDVFPQLWVYGSQGSGKTRLLELLSAITYHGVMSGHITVAALSTLTEQAKITILLDETERLNSKDNPDMWDFVLTRYRKGSYYIYKNKDKGNIEMQACWGLSAFAGRDRPNEPLGSRCLLIIAKKQIGRPKMADKNFQQNLRQLLYIFRLKLLQTLLGQCVPSVPKLSLSGALGTCGTVPMVHSIFLYIYNKVNDNIQVVEAKTFNRINEIIEPLHVCTLLLSQVSQVSQMSQNNIELLIQNEQSPILQNNENSHIVTQNIINSINKYMDKRKEEQKVEEKELIDVEVLEAIDNYLKDNPDNPDNPSTSEITDLVNNSKKEKEKISLRYIGKVLKRLGYKQSMHHGGKRCYIIEEKLHKYNKQRFGLFDEEEQTEQKVLDINADNPKEEVKADESVENIGEE